MKGVPIVTAGTASTCLETGQTCVLVFHEGLWMGESMSNSLINPNQLRAYGCTVQDNPFFGSLLYIEDPEDVLMIPMETAGTNILATTRTPTQDELDNCPHVVLTSQREWEPSNVIFPAPWWKIDEDKASRISGVQTEHVHCEEIVGKMFQCRWIFSAVDCQL